VPRSTPGLKVRTVNDLLHALAAGFFPGTVAGAWVVRGAINAVDPGGGAIVERATGGLVLVMILALGLSIGTGILRLRYWQLNVRQGFLETKKQMVVTKHIYFVFMVLLTTWALAAL